MADTGARTIRMQSQATLPPEDQSRADLYALLARLLYAGPDERVLQLLHSAAGLLEVPPGEGTEQRAGTAVAADGNAMLAAAWRELVGQARHADALAETATFDGVFVGTGKAKVTPYVTHYLVTQGRERILVALRDELAALGLARRGGVHEPEDHIAGLCEVMRHLVSQGSTDASLRTQRAFFDRFIRAGYEGLCDAIAAEPGLSPFYRAVGALARAFLQIESRAFELLD